MSCQIETSVALTPVASRVMSTPCFPTVVFQPRRPNLQVDKMLNAVCPTKTSIGMTPVRLSPLGSATWISKRTLQKPSIATSLPLAACTGLAKLWTSVCWKCCKASLVITFTEAPLSNNQKPDSTLALLIDSKTERWSWWCAISESQSSQSWSYTRDEVTKDQSHS